jgi:ATP-dependent protease HslVU (ClpYQ) peptidase subunit
MTTLVAIQGEGWAVVGADRRSTDSSGTAVVMATSKIVENNGYLIAGAGSVRGCNILQYGFKPPKPVGDLDVFMTRKFIPAMRKAFLEAGYDIKQESAAAEHDSEFIIVVKGSVYLISDDYSWERSKTGFYTAGSGGHYALGALEALSAYERITLIRAKKIVETALSISCRLDPFSSHPYDVFTQEY